MIALQTAFGAVLVAAWLLKLGDLRPSPSDPARDGKLVLALYLSFLLVKFVLSIGPVEKGLDAWMVPGTANAGQMLCSIVAMYMLVTFFLHKARLTNRARLEVIVPVLVGTTMVLALLAAPADIRPLIFEKADQASVEAMIYFGATNVYLAYGLGVALYGAAHYAPRANGKALRTGLVTTAVGMGGALLFAALAQVVSVVLRHFDIEVPAGLDFAIYVVASLSTMAVFVGLCIPQVAHWQQQRLVLIGTRYGWGRLAAVFPKCNSMGALPTLEGERRDLLSVQARYERRRVDMQDALRELSPWIDAPLPADASEQGPAARDALARASVATAEPPRVSSPAPVAAPTECCEAAVNRALVAFSGSLENADAAPSDPAPSPPPLAQA